MTRCRHCNKLTHSEDLSVYFKMDDLEKVSELISLENWTPKYMYSIYEAEKIPPNEWGKLKCGDIYIHFIVEQS